MLVKISKFACCMWALDLRHTLLYPFLYRLLNEYGQHLIDLNCYPYFYVDNFCSDRIIYEMITFI